MNNILFIILGMIIWQIIVFIVLVLTNEDDDITIKIGCGLPLLIFNSTMFVLKNIRKFYIRKNYVAVSIWNEKDANNKEMFLKNVRIKKNTLQNYHLKGENQYYIEEFETSKNIWIERFENIKKVRENGWYCQDWIDENLLKKKNKTRVRFLLLILNSVILPLNKIKNIYIRKNYVIVSIWNAENNEPFFVKHVRVKKNTLQNYYSKGEHQYYIETNNNYIENLENIKNVRNKKHGYYSQKWINENLIKK